MKLVFLGKLADLAGHSECLVDATVTLDWPDLVALIEDRCGKPLADEIRSVRVRVAMNGKLLADKEGVEAVNGDEVAFLPPVSGG